MAREFSNAFSSAYAGGTQVLSASLFMNASGFFASQVDQRIFPALYQNVNTFYPVTAVQVLTPSLFTNANAFFGHQVNAQIHVALFENENEFFDTSIGKVRSKRGGGYITTPRKPQLEAHEQRALLRQSVERAFETITPRMTRAPANIKPRHFRSQFQFAPPAPVRADADAEIILLLVA